MSTPILQDPRFSARWEALQSALGLVLRRACVTTDANVAPFRAAVADAQHALRRLAELSTTDPAERATVALDDLIAALRATDAALREHPGGDNRSEADIAAARRALQQANKETNP